MFALSVFSFVVLLPHRSLLPNSDLLLLSFLLLSETSPSTCRSFCLPPPFFVPLSSLCRPFDPCVFVCTLDYSSSCVFILSRFCFIVFAFSSHTPWKVAVNVFELLSTTTVSCPFVVPLILVCFCALLTTHSLPFFSAFLSPPHDCSQSLRPIFCQPFFHVFFDF